MYINIFTTFLKLKYKNKIYFYFINKFKFIIL